jgi:hypothetical protein
MAEQNLTTLQAPPHWSLRTIVDPVGIAFGIGLNGGGAFLGAFNEALHRRAWSDAAMAFLPIALCLFVVCVYTAGFRALTSRPAGPPKGTKDAVLGRK